MKKSCLRQQDLQSALSGVKCWSSSHVKRVPDARLENFSASPSVVSELKNRTMTFMQGFGILFMFLTLVQRLCVVVGLGAPAGKQ